MSAASPIPLSSPHSVLSIARHVDPYPASVSFSDIGSPSANHHLDHQPNLPSSAQTNGSASNMAKGVGTQSPPAAPDETASVKETGNVAWGSNFWVTLVDPQSQTSFFACPATGHVSWDPPVGNFVLPPSAEGEWWELSDESRGGLPYYYQTKTGETVWERPEGFVIPLGIIQDTALGRRLSQTTFNRSSKVMDPGTTTSDVSRQQEAQQQQPSYQRSRSLTFEDDLQQQQRARDHAGGRSRTAPAARPSPANKTPNSSGVSTGNHGRTPPSYASPNGGNSGSGSKRPLSSSDPRWLNATHLPPIPGSPCATDASAPPSPSSGKSSKFSARTWDSSPEKDSPLRHPHTPENGLMHGAGSAHGGRNGNGNGNVSVNATPPSHAGERPRPRSPSFVPSSGPPRSLAAAVEMLANSPFAEKRSVSESGHESPSSTKPPRRSAEHHHTPSSSSYNTPSPKDKSGGKGILTAKSSPLRRTAVQPASTAQPKEPFWSRHPGSHIIGKDIGHPRLDFEATLNMSPVKFRLASKPIPVEPTRPLRIPISAPSIDTKCGPCHILPRSTVVLADALHNDTHRVTDGDSKSLKTYPVLPHDLASDIQQFVQSDYAKRYFSTHRTGFIFRRRVPVAQMMSWQKSPLTAPLLSVNRGLSKEAVKIFKVIQRIMGDRDRDRPVGVPLRRTDYPYLLGSNTSTASLSSTLVGLLEEERWLLAEGLAHGELRDEIYCQVMKQLTGNPNPESAFRGWQLLCVLLITFPPSKNFELYLRSFIQQRTTQFEGRIDVMAKYCVRRLGFISKKGPRGKPPTLAEIETASDAAFNPSTFGESLDATIRLQERKYPNQKVPIILPFLADGILALGGTQAEGIFRVPGDGDAVSELKLRIDRGYYTLDGVDDPHVLASLLKLWLRELCEPLVPEEMYNECIAARESEECVGIVRRLPSINRRVVLFVVSFLQLFLEERIQSATKMTPANLALVMTPNLLRCNSDSMAVVFTNAQYEQIFVYNLLLHLKCNDVDKDYIPAHGLGAVSTGPMLRTSKSRRRPQ